MLPEPFGIALKAVYFVQNLNLFVVKAILTNHKGPIGNDGLSLVQFFH